MAWLALDASTEACAVGLQNDDGVIFEAFEIAPRRHTELVPKMLDTVLAESGLKKQDIKGCIVGLGPGAFTGIRIGVATIQGIALGLNVPCYGVSSLLALAQQAYFQTACKGSILACIDARMDEVYCAEYAVIADQSLQLVAEEALVSNEAFSLPSSCTLIAGSGVACVKDQLSDVIEKLDECYPTASALFQLFATQNLKPITAQDLSPSYIRNQVTYQNKKA